ncbi:MAG: hypothetical protein A3G23_14410 [Bacteroidetes bacterium RIFCSPLOWO2_12_FULL_37_12]|nr:MAG: hypothetical protein A3G23_14410 [Bacteroidetes bacterium RIFCSPLOWO2_12_FULL_37_12]
MNEFDVTMKEDHTSSPLYSEDLAPVPQNKRTWNVWNLTALWIGMAVCIPTYILASYMIRTGLSWFESLIIIGLANVVITLPMVLNGHAGVKYGIPFPVLGRAAFGTRGIHLPSFVRGIVACGWFGVQTWIGGLAIYAIYNATTGQASVTGLDAGKFICFFIFWIINIYFIWKGTESIKWLEDYSAPILIIIGVILIGWGWGSVGSFRNVLTNGRQTEKPGAFLEKNNTSSGNTYKLVLNPLRDKDGKLKAEKFRYGIIETNGKILWSTWSDLNEKNSISISPWQISDTTSFNQGKTGIKVQYKKTGTIPENDILSSEVEFKFTSVTIGSKIWEYILWFTAMVGFWATMSISISDITRYAKTQKDQIAGQFLGLPGTMIFYSFVGIFVTYAASLIFPDILTSEDAPWDPVSLISRFKNPWVVVFSQIAMLIATLSTNIAANVIAPANVFSNLMPGKISFRMGGVITGLIGIIICPWWLLDQISGFLIFVSGLLGPVVGILLCDYFVIRKTKLIPDELYKVNGIYSFGKSGINSKAMIALFAGVLFALIGKWIPSLNFLFSLSWFSGFFVSFIVYWGLMQKGKEIVK